MTRYFQKSELVQLPEAAVQYISRVLDAADAVAQSRINTLIPAVRFIETNRPAALVFICTHNARRSHLSQVWAQIAAGWYGLQNVTTFSGGTEVTACNPRTVAALNRTGLLFASDNQLSNPHYVYNVPGLASSMELYSKLISDTPNPTSGFAAMMCCSDVDETCPIVPGAALRVPLHYVDPKSAEGTPEEEAVYDERCFQIATEMFWIMREARAGITDQARP